MIDLIVGIAVFCFVILGVREGVAKALGSVALVFAALFLATGTIEFLSKSAPQFKEPSYLGTIIVFLLVWLVSYIILDLLLTLLFRKIIKIIVLGPLDKVGGLLVGGFKGILICGIILQLVLAMPVSAEFKKRITESKLAHSAISIYRWAYPYAKRIAPKLSSLMKINLSEEMKKIEAAEPREGEMSPEKIMGEITEDSKVLSAQAEKIKKLVKEQKILPTVPQGKR